jgi:hypothetical protein
VSDTLRWMAFVILVVVLAFGGNGLWPTQSTNFIEVKCKVNDFLDNDRHCKGGIAGVGATLSVKVNTSTQQVLLEVTESDTYWPKGSYFLDGCRVVDASNWECSRNRGGDVSKPTDIYGMSKGQFFKFYRSSSASGFDAGSASYGISGWRYWAVYLGIISAKQALGFEHTAGN